MGLVPKIIDRIIDEGLASDPADLFKLKVGDILPLERFAEKSASNLIEAIQKSKIIGLSRFIYALGILHVGEETAINLAQYFFARSGPSSGWAIIDTLKKASKEELADIPDVGEVVAESINFWFRLKQNEKLINDFLKSGIKILQPKKAGEKLAGKSFMLTGTLESITRAEAEKRIRMLGGKPSSSISKETDFLVAGSNPGSKFYKAKELGVEIIGEKRFLEMIG